MAKITTKETKIITINICDYKNCEERVDFLYIQRICKGCQGVFCEDHLFDVYGNEDDADKGKNRIILCSYCFDIYEEKIKPFLSEIDKIYEEMNKISKKEEKVRNKMKNVCKKNYKKRIGEYND